MGVVIEIYLKRLRGSIFYYTVRTGTGTVLYYTAGGAGALPPRMELSLELYRRNYWAKNNQTKHV